MYKKFQVGITNSQRISFCANAGPTSWLRLWPCLRQALQPSSEKKKKMEASASSVFPPSLPRPAAACAHWCVALVQRTGLPGPALSRPVPPGALHCSRFRQPLGELPGTSTIVQLHLLCALSERLPTMLHASPTETNYEEN